MGEPVGDKGLNDICACMNCVSESVFHFASVRGQLEKHLYCFFKTDERLSLFSKRLTEEVGELQVQNSHLEDEISEWSMNITQNSTNP